MSGSNRKVVAATEHPSGRLTVVCDDGSVFAFYEDKWTESRPVPGTDAEQSSR